ncbi:putative ABC transport system ATP-binding protein [Streptoalloteichus tenebrarius]|uniref:ABC transport system ATP-binding protein n=1 Tax=Streptoalloteichus tenebrarius (strain ATCC 17920 / DSM 40477 / JCM 4838 / CBS 697.72 / NBRC 16177 / NCIMB 11028 / NRRL B-12390 / A12253. 1 / ISP 5477) TaxID=1933 RepID=A0ABT1HRT7_STRSD|nr:ABC transporter ATP-binding protein [Streptoalloteichus tenebrarius]MCP2258236.1 putative ABC transport system ATP-binding protein [Streptoalloteichus tenebrarius]
MDEAVVPALRMDRVSKEYGRGSGRVRALDSVDLRVERGSFVAVMGPSGSGKSTLLQCAAGLDEVSDGTVHIGRIPVSGLDETQRAMLRRDRVGFVFQSYNLLAGLTAAQNIEVPVRLAGGRVDPVVVRDLASRVGVEDLLRRRPHEMSGGQRQRVALARALVTEPEIVFGDEPTGALDTGSARQVLALMRELVHRDGRTIVMVTHDPVAAAHADRVLFLADGRIVDEATSPSVDGVLRRMARLEAAGC